MTSGFAIWRFGLQVLSPAAVRLSTQLDQRNVLRPVLSGSPEQSSGRSGSISRIAGQRPTAWGPTIGRPDVAVFVCHGSPFGGPRLGSCTWDGGQVDGWIPNREGDWLASNPSREGTHAAADPSIHKTNQSRSRRASQIFRPAGRREANSGTHSFHRSSQPNLPSEIHVEI